VTERSSHRTDVRCLLSLFRNTPCVGDQNKHAAARCVHELISGFAGDPELHQPMFTLLADLENKNPQIFFPRLDCEAVKHEEVWTLGQTSKDILCVNTDDRKNLGLEYVVILMGHGLFESTSRNFAYKIIVSGSPNGV
jgi:hypothetical protein